MTPTDLSFLEGQAGNPDVVCNMHRTTMRQYDPAFFV